MYIQCIYMYIHPMSRFVGSVNVYTLMYHVQTGTHILLQMYRLLLSEYIHRCTIMVSAFFVLPGWQACNQ